MLRLDISAAVLQSVNDHFANVYIVFCYMHLTKTSWWNTKVPTDLEKDEVACALNELLTHVRILSFIL